MKFKTVIWMLILGLIMLSGCKTETTSVNNEEVDYNLTDENPTIIEVENEEKVDDNKSEYGLKPEDNKPSTSSPSASESSISESASDYAHVKPMVGKDVEYVAVKYLECVHKFDEEIFISLIGGVEGENISIFQEQAKNFNMSVIDFGKMALRSNKEEFESEVGRDWITRFSIEDVNYESNDEMAYVYLEFDSSDFVLQLVFKLVDGAWVIY